MDLTNSCKALTLLIYTLGTIRILLTLIQDRRDKSLSIIIASECPIEDSFGIMTMNRFAIYATKQSWRQSY